MYRNYNEFVFHPKYGNLQSNINLDNLEIVWLMNCRIVLNQADYQ